MKWPWRASREEIEAVAVLLVAITRLEAKLDGAGAELSDAERREISYRHGVAVAEAYHKGVRDGLAAKPARGD